MQVLNLNSMPEETHFEFVDPSSTQLHDIWDNFTLPSAKSATVLAILGLLLACNLCIVHYLTQNKRQLSGSTPKGFDPVSTVEAGQGGAGMDNNDDGDLNDTVDENDTQASTRPRYPAIDFFRGKLILYVVIFHIIWALEEFQFLPFPPVEGAFNMPVSNYLCFAAFYIVSCCWFYLAYITNPYALYLVYPLVTLTCIYMIYWESEVSGVCLLMLCVGVSLGIVHEDRIKWRSFFIRAIKLGIAAGIISAVTYTVMPESPIYFGAIHCIWLNSNLAMIFIRTPRLALLGYFFIQFYTIHIGLFPLEVPLNRPTVDVIPWFHNLGYCLLGLWLHSIGFHRIEVVELMPGKPVDLGKNAFTIFGRHSLTVYLSHMLPVLLVLGIFKPLQGKGL